MDMAGNWPNCATGAFTGGTFQSFDFQCAPKGSRIELQAFPPGAAAVTHADRQPEHPQGSQVVPYLTLRRRTGQRRNDLPQGESGGSIREQGQNRSLALGDRPLDTSWRYWS